MDYRKIKKTAAKHMIAEACVKHYGFAPTMRSIFIHSKGKSHICFSVRGKMYKLYLWHDCDLVTRCTEWECPAISN